MLNLEDLIGRYVIVRCRDAGVHAGKLESVEGRSCILTEARRLWYWKVLKGAGDFLNGISLKGLAAGSKVSGHVERILLTENCEVIACTPEAEQNIRSFEVFNG